MRTKIISAFPGTGKSYYYNKHKDSCIDSDSSEFSWVKDKDGNNTKERNPNFPQNYIDHIKNNIGKYEYIFVSSHKDVRDSLKDNCIFYYLFYPDRSRKDEFLERYVQRGSPETFVKLIDVNWDNWINECFLDITGCKSICIRGSSNLEDVIEKI